MLPEKIAGVCTLVSGMCKKDIGFRGDGEHTLKFMGIVFCTEVVTSPSNKREARA